MTYAPQDLMNVRARVSRLTGLSGNALGIVGDPAHEGGYHCGSDRTIDDDYSVVESSRDSRGLTQAASALDIGDFPGLQALSIALARACANGDPRGRDVREIIYSPDGENVVRWDDLGVRSSGDDSHLWHTHISFYRDAEGRRNNEDSFGGLIQAILTGAGPAATEDDVALNDVDIMRVSQQTVSDLLGLIQGTKGSGVSDAKTSKGFVAATYRNSDPAGMALLDKLFAGAGTAQLSDAQLSTLVTSVVNAVVAHPDTPLGDADKPAIRAAVKEALTAIVTGK